MSKHKVLTIKEIRKQYDSKVVIELALVNRAAHFFNWAANNYTKSWIPWNWTLQAILGLARTPTLDSHGVIALRHDSGRIRAILQRDYQRDMTIAKGLGARATVDSEDTLKTEAVKKAGRIRSAIKSAQTTVDLINPKQIPDTPENAPWKRWLSQSLSGAMREISSIAFERKMLPPGDDKK